MRSLSCLAALEVPVLLVASCGNSDSSTTTDEFHLHGYDIDSGEITAGQAAVFEFDATQPGTFEIESHSSEQVLVVFQIS